MSLTLAVLALVEAAPGPVPTHHLYPLLAVRRGHRRQTVYGILVRLEQSGLVRRAGTVPVGRCGRAVLWAKGGAA